MDYVDKRHKRRDWKERWRYWVVAEPEIGFDFYIPLTIFYYITFIFM